MRGNAAWHAPLAIVLVAVGGSSAAVAMPDTPALITRFVVGVLAVAAILYGSRRHRARPAVSWWVIAAGIGMFVLADLIWDLMEANLSDLDSDWFILPSVLYTLVYPALVWAIVRIAAAQGRRRNVERIVDAFIPAVLLLMLIRVFALRGDQFGTDIDSLFNAAYPVGDALLLAAVTWLLFTPGLRTWSTWTLAAGATTLLATDVFWDLEEQLSPGSWTWIADPLYPLAYALIAAAALHPSVGTMATRSDAGDGRGEHTARLVLLCVALALTPVVAFASPRHDVLIEALTGVLVVAVGIRFVRLVRALQATQRDAQRSAHRLTGLLASVPVGIMEADPAARIIFSNHAIDDMIGRSAVGMTGEDIIDEFVDPRDKDAARQAVATVVSGRNAIAQMRMRGADGIERWVAWYGAPVQDGSGCFAGAFASVVEITTMKQAERALALQATHDPLTALPNRRLLYDRLSSALSRLGRQPGVVVVLFLDLDGFKIVNDSCGHDAGDDLLKVVAARLRRCVRTDDTVARIGGDEFVVVLERMRDRSDAAFVAGKIVQSISTPVQLRRARTTVRVGASVGIAVSTSASDDPDALLSDADAAMFDAKRAGRGTYRFFSHRAAAGAEEIRRGDLREHI